MKPKNFPARKLARQLKAQHRAGEGVENAIERLNTARGIRTKQRRTAKV